MKARWLVPAIAVLTLTVVALPAMAQMNGSNTGAGSETKDKSMMNDKSMGGGGMAGGMQDRMKMREQMNQQLQEKVDAMKAATGDAKIPAMEAVIEELVSQHMQMQKMMERRDGMMMQRMNEEKSGKQPATNEEMKKEREQMELEGTDQPKPNTGMMNQ